LSSSVIFRTVDFVGLEFGLIKVIYDDEITPETYLLSSSKIVFFFEVGVKTTSSKS
jgi:hypothetical protein